MGIRIGGGSPQDKGADGKGGWTGKGGPRPNRPTNKGGELHDRWNATEGEATKKLLRAEDDQDVRHTCQQVEGRGTGTRTEQG